MEELHFFDRKQPYAVAYKKLPHWAQAGVVSFITWRTGDSLPVAAVRRIDERRSVALKQFGLDPASNWREHLARLPAPDRRRLQWELFTTLDDELDHNFGECVLARPELSQIVLDSLLHFDGVRYVLTDAVVMPNHVHVLVAFREEDALITQCQGWKRYTSRIIQKSLGRQGEFWQTEQFDHLVRGPEQFGRFRGYIADNPKRARLSENMYRLYSKQLT
jgi:putative transposase